MSASSIAPPIERGLRERQVDLVVAPLRKPIVEDFGAIFLYQNRLRVVVGMKSPWMRRRKIKLSDLVNGPWCAPPLDFPSGAQFLDAFRASGLPRPRVVVSCDANHFCHAMLRDGRFLGISGDGYLYFYAERESLKVLPVELPASPFEISIIILKHRTIPPLAQRFIDCAREVVQPLVKEKKVGRMSAFGPSQLNWADAIGNYEYNGFLFARLTEVADAVYPPSNASTVSIANEDTWDKAKPRLTAMAETADGH